MTNYLLWTVIVVIILLLTKWGYDNFQLDTIEFPWKVVFKRRKQGQPKNLAQVKHNTISSERLNISKEFIGRNHEIQLFREFYEKFLRTQDHKIHAFLIHGEQGIGKSWYLNRICTDDGETSPKIFFIDLLVEKSKGFDVIRSFQSEIRKQAHELKTNKFFKVYDDRLKELTSFREEKSPLDSDELGLWGQETLTDLLIEAVNQVSQKHTVIIAIDSFEVATEFSEWFQNYFLRKLKGKILIVISGQRDTLLGFVRILEADQVKSIRLNAFTSEDLHSYLLKKNFNFDEQSVYSLTGGNPLALSFLTAIASTSNLSGVPALKTEFAYNLVTNLLPDLPAQDREIIYTMAVLKFFDNDILSEVINHSVNVEDFASKFRFLRFSENGWQLHEIVSRSARTLVQQTNPDKFNSINKKAMNIWKKRLNKLLEFRVAE